MKTAFLILMLFFCANSSAQQTQDIAFMIKAGILIPFLQAEFPINKHQSINIGTAATYTIEDKSDWFIAPSVELHHFFLNTDKIKPYVGIYTRARIYDVKEGSATHFIHSDGGYNYQTFSLATGDIAGYQLIIRRHFVIDIFGGAGYIPYRPVFSPFFVVRLV